MSTIISPLTDISKRYKIDFEMQTIMDSRRCFGAEVICEAHLQSLLKGLLNGRQRSAVCRSGSGSKQRFAPLPWQQLSGNAAKGQVVLQDLRQEKKKCPDNGVRRVS
ncbi:MAG: hypothetical protein ABSA74_04215, partial [Candidatus Staskawiczbacteria bacterium]